MPQSARDAFANFFTVCVALKRETHLQTIRPIQAHVCSARANATLKNEPPSIRQALVKLKCTRLSNDSHILKTIRL
eukprot:94090-Pyramimonas_sp.AAC.1